MQFVLALGAVSLFLWNADAMGTGEAALWVAVGAGVFMASDALIAIDKFLTPVPLAPLWILLTYYCAQMLIVHHARPVAISPANRQSPAAASRPSAGRPPA